MMLPLFVNEESSEYVVQQAGDPMNTRNQGRLYPDTSSSDFNIVHFY